MFTLSAFTDEISPELEEQLDALQSQGLRYLELRSVWAKNVLDFTDEEVRRIRTELDARGIGVSAIGSPIGKIRLSDAFEPHLERFRRALDLAALFDCGHIRLFSFYPSEGLDGTVPPRGQVLERMRSLDSVAREYEVKLALENEAGLYGDTPERCRDLLTALPPGRWVMVFDPGNFASAGIPPFDRAFPLLEEYIGYCHIKDTLACSTEGVPAGQGEAQIPELLRALHEIGVSCYLTLEPHLGQWGQFGGFTGSEGFPLAANALKAIIADVGAQWN